MATTTQILVGTSARPRVIFYSNGVPTDLDSGVPVVTITRPDLTLVAAGAVAHVGAAGSGTYEVSLAAQTEVTLLTVAWAGAIGGQPQTLTTTVEVVGALLFPLSAAKAWDGGAITGQATDTDIIAKRVEIADDFQRICGVSFFPRFARETHDAAGGDILLHHQRVARLLSVTVAGAAQSPAGYYVSGAGVLRPASGYHPGPPFPAGIGSVTVEYVHGWDQVPGPISTAALRVARAQLVPSNIGDRATSITNDAGTILLATAGRGQFQPYGIPLVDSVLARYFEPLAA